jgi:hypothetical protein
LDNETFGSATYHSQWRGYLGYPKVDPTTQGIDEDAKFAHLLGKRLYLDPRRSLGSIPINHGDLIARIEGSLLHIDNDGCAERADMSPGIASQAELRRHRTPDGNIVRGLRVIELGLTPIAHPPGSDLEAPTYIYAVNSNRISECPGTVASDDNVLGGHNGDGTEFSLGEIVDMSMCRSAHFSAPLHPFLWLYLKR